MTGLQKQRSDSSEKKSKWLSTRRKSRKNAGKKAMLNYLSKSHETESSAVGEGEADLQPYSSPEVVDRNPGTCTPNDAPPMVVVRGSYHQGDTSKFPREHAGNQCTAMAAAAIVMAAVASPAEWTSQVIDEILCAGDNLYRLSLSTRAPVIAAAGINTKHLAVDELFKAVEISGLIWQFNISLFPMQGHLWSREYPTLEVTLASFFETANTGIFTANGLSIAVFKMYNRFFIFDSHSRGKDGAVTLNGTACVINFPSLVSLCGMIRNNFPFVEETNINRFTANIFSVTAIAVEAGRSSDDNIQASDPPANISASSLPDEIPQCSAARDLDNMSCDEETMEVDSSDLQSVAQGHLSLDSDEHSDEGTDCSESDDQSSCDGSCCGGSCGDSSSDSSSINVSLQQPAHTAVERIIENDVEEPPSLSQLDIESEHNENPISCDGGISNKERSYEQSGRIIVDPGYHMNELNSQLNEHFNDSENPQCDVVRNWKYLGYDRVGLRSLLHYECTTCTFQFHIMNEEVAEDVMDSTTAMIMGCINIGIGHSQLTSLLAANNMHCVHESTWKKKFNNLHSHILKATQLNMKEKGKEVYELAKAKGNMKGDVALATVTADGVYSERGYNGVHRANGGCATIVSMDTGKILFAGVRNRNCRICKRAANRGTDARPHKCYRNWDKSPGAMETHIILEGFKRSIQDHNIAYHIIVADGDNSCIAAIQNNRIYRDIGVTFSKVQCAVHAIRNVGHRLHEVHVPTRSLGITLVIKRQNDEKIKAVIRTAAKHWRERDLPESEKGVELRKDIQNSWNHVWGKHDNCRSSYCNGQSEGSNYVALMGEPLKNRFNWAVERCADLAHDLIKNQNNNYAEAPNNAIVTSWGAKRIDTSQSNALETRAMCAILRYNSGQPYTDIAKAMGKEPFVVAETLEEQYRRKLLRRKEKIRKDKAEGTHVPRRLQRTRLPACTDYGTAVEQPDLDPAIMQEKTELHYEKLKAWQNDRVGIERRTVLQSKCEEWNVIRSELLTASLYGKVCKRRPGTSCRTIVKQIVYPSYNLKSTALKYGRDNEKIALAKFLEVERITNPDAQVEECGLFLDPKIAGLGATPDALYGHKAIVEIKCPKSAEELGIAHALTVKGSPVKRMFTSCGTAIKKTHDYYYQIQGQLRATGRDVCYFFVWSPHDYKCVKVERCSDEEWQKMADKLEKFYRHCIVPELVHPRGADKIRDPEYITQFQKKKSSTDQSQPNVVESTEPAVSQCVTVQSGQDDLDNILSDVLPVEQPVSQLCSDDNLSDWDDLVSASQNFEYDILE